MRFYISIFVFVLFISCDEDKEINQPPAAGFQVFEGIDRINFDASNSSDPEGNTLSYKWSSTSSQLTFSNITLRNTAIMIPKGDTDALADVTLVVSDGASESSITQTVTIPALTAIREYGLGKQAIKEISNSQKYDWYFDQANTGSSSLLNCGPASVTAAVKWTKEEFTATPADARNKYRSSGGWWYTSDVIGYLNDNGVNNWTISLSNFQDIKTEIDKGNIVILCLDMHEIAYNQQPKQRYDKFYVTENAGWGHFIVIKGYKEVDNQTYFEAYDPYSFNNRYDDGNLKGKDRYYRESTLDRAVEIWWDYGIVVSRAPATGGRKGINVDNIVHMPGR